MPLKLVDAESLFQFNYQKLRKNMTSSLGIDLGNTYSSAAYLNDEMVPITLSISGDSSGLSQIPSTVLFHEDGSYQAGVVPDPKRSDKALISSMKRWIHREKNSSGQYVAYPLQMISRKDDELKVGEKNWSAHEVCSLILKNLKERSEKKLSSEVSSATITFPLCFGKNQQDLIRQSAQSAGFKKVEMIDETLAAALAYAYCEKKKGRILFFDLGGGTLDVALIDLQENSLKVLSCAGTADLGSDDMDHRIAQRLLMEIEDKYGKDIANSDEMKKFFYEDSERAKRALSHRGSYDFRFSNPEKGIEYQRSLSRFEMTQMIQDLIDQAVEYCEHVLAVANLKKEDLDGVVLTGGASRMLVLQHTLEKFFGKKPCLSLNPSDAVAMGAAVYGGIKDGSLPAFQIELAKPASIA